MHFPYPLVTSFEARIQTENIMVMLYTQRELKRECDRRRFLISTTNYVG